MVETILNATSFYVPTSVVEGGQEVIYVDQTMHAISLSDTLLAVGGYIVLSYFWIKVNQNKPYYEKWINPNGKEINLVKRIRLMMIIYPIVVVILGLLQIYLTINR
jgi:hypothetical protein